MAHGPMDWNDLHVLLMVAETGSLNAAAERLGMTQPTVNRKVSELEGFFKTKLVERGRSGSELTERGKDILPLITKMGHAGLQIEKLARHYADTPDGVVTIVAPDLLGAQIISPKIADFMNDNPDITIQLDCGLWQTNLEPMTPDILVGYSKPAELSAYTEIICHTHYCWYASIDYLRRFGIPYENGDIISHRLLWQVAQQHQREDWPEDTDALAKLARPRMRMITNSSASFLSAMRGGAGIGALPSYMTELYQDLVPIPLSEAKDAHVYLSVDRAVSKTRRVKKVTKWLRDHVLHPSNNRWLAEQFHHPFDWWSERHPKTIKDIEASAATPPPSMSFKSNSLRTRRLS